MSAAAGKHRRRGGDGITGRFGRIRVPLFRPAFHILEIVGLVGRLAIQLRAEFWREHLPSLQVEIVQQTRPFLMRVVVQFRTRIGGNDAAYSGHVAGREALREARKRMG